MIIEQIKLRGVVIGEIRKPDSSRRWQWSAYIKGRMGFRDCYAFIGYFGGKPAAKRAVREWARA